MQGCTHTQGCTQGCACPGMCTYVLSCSVTFPTCRVCIREVREEILAWAGHWAPVQALGAVLQAHDCVSRAQTPLPHVFRGTCFVANSLFVNNCRDVAESPRCGREPAGIRGWFCPVVTRALPSARVGFLRDTPNSHSKLPPCSCPVSFAPLHWVETEAGSAQARL